MKIGVSGASGQLGKAVVKQLQARDGGHEVVAISRTPEAIAGVEARLGDYDRPETLAAAYAGLDRLLLIPSADMRPGVRGQQFIAAIDAAVAAGVGHLVLVSTAGTRQSDTVLGAPYWQGEQHLIRRAPRWTILRMNYYVESFAQQAGLPLGTGVLAGLGEGRVAFVSRDDVAAAAAGILLGKGRAGAIYNATGPAAITGAGRAAALAEITGKPVRFETLDEPALRNGLAAAGVPPQYIEPMVHIEESFAEGAFDIVTGDVTHLSGRPPRTFSEVLRNELAHPRT